jgi:hypothetical protein
MPLFVFLRKEPDMADALDKLPLDALIGPVARATEALVRLDERLARSPVRDGWIERSHFHDAAAALWLEGELVHVEDLVLHDAHMDIRTPTHELTRAHAVLRARRQILSHPPDWALGREGRRQLTGRDRLSATTPARNGRGGEGASAGEEASGVAEPAEDDPFAHDLAAIDAVLERSAKILDGVDAGPKKPAAAERPSLVYDLDWNEEERLAEWQAVLAETGDRPVVLRARCSLTRGTTSRFCSTLPGSGRCSLPPCCGRKDSPPTISPACISAPKRLRASAGGPAVAQSACLPFSTPCTRRRWLD